MDSVEQRRNYIRFNPEDLDIAIASLNQKDFQHYDSMTHDFSGNMVGLILDQSFKGASIAVVNKEKSDSFMPVGYKCILKVGQLAPLPAEVKWREVVSGDLLKLGFEFLQ